MVEPDGHGIGRSRGGLTTKVHYAVDGNGRPLAVAVTSGQRNDGAMLQTVLEQIRVPRLPVALHARGLTSCSLTERTQLV